jgi:hypothetical protein
MVRIARLDVTIWKSPWSINQRRSIHVTDDEFGAEQWRFAAAPHRVAQARSARCSDRSFQVKFSKRRTRQALFKKAVL